MIGRGYAVMVFVYKRDKNGERIGKGVSKGGARLITVGAIVFMIVCIVGSI